MKNSKTRIKYLRLMAEIEKRLEVLKGFSNNQINAIYLQATIESEALQLRKILELIAYASLIAHKDVYANAFKDFASHWRAVKIINQIEKLNPDFYPIPTRGLKNGKWFTLKGGYLTKKQFKYLYDKCGVVMHAKNPFSNSSQYCLSFHKKVPNYVFKIEQLLSEHKIKLFGEIDEIHVMVPFHKDQSSLLRCLSKIKG